MSVEQLIIVQLPVVAFLFAIYFSVFQRLNFLGDSRKKKVKRSHALLSFLLVVLTVSYMPLEFFVFFYSFIRNIGVSLVAVFTFIIFFLLFSMIFRHMGERGMMKSFIVAVMITALIFLSAGFPDLSVSFGSYNFVGVYIATLILILFLVLFYIVK